MTTDNRIVKTPGICGGDARVNGHRVPVWALVGCFERMTDVEILRAYLQLEQADLDAAWKYYLDNWEEIEATIRENETDE